MTRANNNKARTLKSQYLKLTKYTITGKATEIENIVFFTKMRF